MATSKTVSVIHNNITMTAAAGDVTSDPWDLQDGYGGVLNVKLTNGATGPTVAGQVQIQCSPDDSNYYNYGGPLVGSTTNSAVRSFTINVPVGVKYVKVVSGSNTGQNVTLRVSGTEVVSV